MHLSLKSLLAIYVVLTTTGATAEAAEDPSIAPADAATLLERQIDVLPIQYTSCEILSGLAIPQPSDACSLASTTTVKASTSPSRTKPPTSTRTKSPATTTKSTTPSITPSTNPAAAWPWTSIQTDPKSYTMALTTTFTPPPECTGSFTQIGTEYWQNAILPAPHTTLTSCYPSEFFSSVVGAANSVSLPPFDPLVCPVGWSSIPWNSTYFACCPE